MRIIGAQAIVGSLFVDAGPTNDVPDESIMTDQSVEQYQLWLNSLYDGLST
jgi:hypothetical protein